MINSEMVCLYTQSSVISFEIRLAWFFCSERNAWNAIFISTTFHELFATETSHEAVNEYHISRPPCPGKPLCSQPQLIFFDEMT